MKIFAELTDDEWASVQTLLHSKPAAHARRGRPPVQARAVVNAVLWFLAAGQHWTGLPGRYPSQTTCRRRFDQWLADGTLVEILGQLERHGRDSALRESLRTPAVKAIIPAPPPAPSNERLRGAFWTNPSSWRAGPAGY